MESGVKGNMENLVSSETADGVVDSVKVRCDQDDVNGVVLGDIWCEDTIGLENWLGQIMLDDSESGNSGVTTVCNGKCVSCDNKTHKVDLFDSISTPKLSDKCVDEECSISGASAAKDAHMKEMDMLCHEQKCFADPPKHQCHTSIGQNGYGVQKKEEKLAIEDIPEAS